MLPELGGLQQRPKLLPKGLGASGLPHIARGDPRRAAWFPHVALWCCHHDISALRLHPCGVPAVRIRYQPAVVDAE